MTPEPPPDMGRVELGTCTGCGDQAYGHPVEGPPGCPVRVEHCTGGEDRRDSPQLTAAAAVSVAGLVVLCVLLLTVWR